MTSTLVLSVASIIISLIPLGIFCFIYVKTKAASSFGINAEPQIGGQATAFNHFFRTIQLRKFESKDLSKQLESGNLENAEQVAFQQLQRHPHDMRAPYNYIWILLMFDTIEKTNRAWEIVKEKNITDLDIYRAISIKFWMLGDIEKAIVVAEKELFIANDVYDRDQECVTKNNLAYFYAVTGKDKYKEKAIYYAKEAYKNRPNDATRLDTKGYVEITFAQDKEEILHGIDLCYSAFIKDTEKAKHFGKHIGRGLERIAEITGHLA